MIAHLVLFRFKPGVSRDDPRLAALVQAMNALPEQILQIRGWEHGFNLAPEPQAADYGLHALFDTREDLHAYFAHPAHLPVVAQWEALSELTFCDYES